MVLRNSSAPTIDLADTLSSLDDEEDAIDDVPSSTISSAPSNAPSTSALPPSSSATFWRGAAGAGCACSLRRRLDEGRCDLPAISEEGGTS